MAMHTSNLPTLVGKALGYLLSIFGSIFFVYFMFVPHSFKFNHDSSMTMAGYEFLLGVSEAS
ncbi:MAG: hypothetical protein ABEI77_10615, partial [Halorientalis sp.]